MKHEKKLLYLVSDYCEGGPLSNYIYFNQDLNELEAINIFKEIILGYSEIFKGKIYHGDLRLENILMKGKTW